MEEESRGWTLFHIEVLGARAWRGEARFEVGIWGMYYSQQVYGMLLPILTYRGTSGKEKRVRKDTFFGNFLLDFRDTRNVSIFYRIIISQAVG